ncbi:hypothetical protein AKJ52_00260 [candidate division MSBL1 archaeon SCGC-AAA382C18]|uniref:NADH:ubiquinone oxidoreductase 30kDa subunit domain-containing protein n=1 Tax=candidate division MSBL1 archaeon SCGC-AAA382C18 TaxID=1698281 RepID=A0A133VLY9_9EURY|nr:hypothetical protein AKJ52_00260 [candidate division MSBL1 archaeon SCGC-AAA382C18]
MNPEEIIDLVQDYTESEEILEERRVVLNTDRDNYRDLLQTLWDEDIKHLSTITATDYGEKTEVIYHISTYDGIFLDLTVEIPDDDLEIQTITDIYPSALLYEREINDLLGIDVLEHPEPGKLVLPDDWPEHKHPLKKGFYDYQKVVELDVSRIKELASDEDFDCEMMLEVEKETKDRKTLKEWLEKQIGEEEEEE